MADTTTDIQINTTALSPSRQARLAVLGWLALHNIPFEVGGRHLIRLFDLTPVNALLAPFVLTSAILTRRAIGQLALVIGGNQDGSDLV